MRNALDGLFEPAEFTPDAQIGQRAVVELDLINLAEPFLVRELLKKLRRTYDAFGFVFDTLRRQRRGWHYTFITEVQRKWLGLDPRLQPGDIDVIIIPGCNGKILLEYTAAIEVKRLSLRSGIVGKNVGRYGGTQARGLVRDGFPLSGILHVIVTEPGPIDNIKNLQQWQVINDQEHVAFVRDVRMDVTGSIAADLQIDRLRSHVLDERIGLNAIALQRSRSLRNGFTVYPSYGREAILNDKPSLSLLAAVGQLANEIRPFAYVRD